MRYQILVKPTAKKQLQKIDKKHQLRISEKISSLADNPFPPSSKQLKARAQRSMRVGVYRVIYDVYEKEIIVLILVISHRKDVYRK